MDYKSFLNEITSSICHILGEEMEVSLRTITKNNNVILDGITIRNENETISPTIYLNPYYEQYLSGDSIPDIVQEIVQFYQENREKQNIDIQFFTQYEKVKDRIVYKLIHYSKNRKLLEKIPHVQFLDMAIVFYYLVRSDVSSNTTILIYNTHIQMWGKKTVEIFRMANQNTQRLLKVQINSIEDVITEESGNSIFFENQESAIPMYVISNHNNFNGASCILYQNVLKDFADHIQSDLFVLPSSIHETIIIPQKSYDVLENLKELVKDTNDKQVEEDEILSYNVYEYSRKKERIKIV